MNFYTYAKQFLLDIKHGTLFSFVDIYKIPHTRIEYSEQLRTACDEETSDTNYWMWWLLFAISGQYLLPCLSTWRAAEYAYHLNISLTVLCVCMTNYTR